MRLTPADVHNVAFKKPSIGKRGYDEDEVDAFLDLVEAELSRLIEENNELTQRVAAGSNGGSSPAAAQVSEAAPVSGSVDHGSVEAAVAAPSVDAQPPAAAPPAAAQPAAAQVSIEKTPVDAPPAPAGETGPAAHHLHAARLLGLAQETAERLTGDAAAEAEATRSAAKEESDRVLAEAQAEAEKLLADAHTRSDAMVSDATAKADALDREAQTKYSQVVDSLSTERSTLERKIEDLRVYEREYRSRLKSWISDQLVQLDDGGSQRSDADQKVQV